MKPPAVAPTAPPRAVRRSERVVERKPRDSGSRRPPRREPPPEEEPDAEAPEPSKGGRVDLRA